MDMPEQAAPRLAPAPTRTMIKPEPGAMFGGRGNTGQ
jgi:hypothetical protein